MQSELIVFTEHPHYNANCSLGVANEDYVYIS